MLEGGHTLAEYKVMNNATLYLLMSLGHGVFVELVEEKPKKLNGACCALQ